MKAKVFLCIAVSLVLFLLGGLVMNHTGQAQINSMSPYVPVFFGEDPYRMHGLQIESYCIQAASYTYSPFLTVPADKRFIVTDLGSDITGVRLANQNHEIKYVAASSQCFISFNSGITYEPNDTVMAYGEPGASYYRVTISGYFVDL